MNNIENLMQEIYKLKTITKQKADTLTALKEEITKDEAEIEKLSTELLEEFKNSDMKVYKLDSIVAEKFTKESVGYTSEADVMLYLKEKYQSNYIKTKITESIDKNALKKALKADTILAEALDSMTIKTATEYVVVTDVENHQKMLEHINANSN